MIPQTQIKTLGEEETLEIFNARENGCCHSGHFVAGYLEIERGFTQWNWGRLFLTRNHTDSLKPTSLLNLPGVFSFSVVVEVDCWEKVGLTLTQGAFEVSGAIDLGKFGRYDCGLEVYGLCCLQKYDTNGFQVVVTKYLEQCALGVSYSRALEFFYHINPGYLTNIPDSGHGEDCFLHWTREWLE